MEAGLCSHGLSLRPKLPFWRLARSFWLLRPFPSRALSLYLGSHCPFSSPPPLSLASSALDLACNLRAERRFRKTEELIKLRNFWPWSSFISFICLTIAG